MSLPDTDNPSSSCPVVPETSTTIVPPPPTTTTTSTVTATSTPNSSSTISTTNTSTTIPTTPIYHHHTPPPSQIPTQFRALSRNNSNTSTASSSNKGELSSTISTVNSVGSSRSQLSKYQQLIGDHQRQLLSVCSSAANANHTNINSSSSTINAGSSSTPIRSFQRATISSVVKTRAFDNNPVLQGLLSSATTSPSGHNSLSNSQTPSPHSTPIFSRSRSLRMSSGPHRYQQSPTHIPQPQAYYHHSHSKYGYRTTSRTPDLSSLNYSGDISSSFSTNAASEPQFKLLELNNEKLELKESLEFLECERQVLLDTSKELKDTLSTERSQWKKEQEELKKQLADQILNRVKAESQITKNEVELNDLRLQADKFKEDISQKGKHIDGLEKRLEKIQADNEELIAINNELRHMLSERLKFNE